MLQCWQPRANVGDDRRLDDPADIAHAFGANVQYVAPRTHEHRVAPRAAAARMRPGLGRSEQITLILDCPRPQQRLPVRLTGARRERGGNDDQREVAERAIKLGEAQVVTDRQADAATWSGKRSGVAAGNDRLRLVVVLVAVRKTEQVNL